MVRTVWAGGGGLRVLHAARMVGSRPRPHPPRTAARLRELPARDGVSPPSRWRGVYEWAASSSSAIQFTSATRRRIALLNHLLPLLWRAPGVLFCIPIASDRNPRHAATLRLVVYITSLL